MQSVCAVPADGLTDRLTGRAALSAFVSVVECDVAVLYTLRRLLLSSAGSDGLSAEQRSGRVRRVTELLAQSARPYPSAAGAVSTATAATARSLLRHASMWCLPCAASDSSVVRFVSCNRLAAADSLASMAQQANDRQRAMLLFAHSTSLKPSSSSGWQGLAQSATDAADSQLARRLQHFNARRAPPAVFA